MSISILLADTNALFMQGLRLTLEKQPDFRIVGEARNSRELARQIDIIEPEVVVMDVSTDEFNPCEISKLQAVKARRTRLIAVSISSDHNLLSRMLRSGVTGYLLKESIHEDLVRAVRSVHENGGYLPPAMTHLVMEDYIRRLNADNDSGLNALTRREKEILARLADGHSSKEIAGDLFISVKTVENHRFQLMRKLDIHNVAELTKFAIRHGLTSL